MEHVIAAFQLAGTVITLVSVIAGFVLWMPRALERAINKNVDPKFAVAKVETAAQFVEMRADTATQFAETAAQFAAMRADTATQFAETAAQFAEMRADTATRFAEARAETTAQFAETREQLKLLGNDMAHAQDDLRIIKQRLIGTDSAA